MIFRINKIQIFMQHFKLRLVCMCLVDYLAERILVYEFDFVFILLR